jgi:hypothetical protein
MNIKVDKMKRRYRDGKNTKFKSAERFLSNGNSLRYLKFY